MSQVNPVGLKSATDETIPSFLREPENGTTANIIHDTLIEFGFLGKGARIVNNDATNNLTVRLHTNNGTAVIIPPSSELSINEWFSQIHCEPNAVSGNFQITIELCDPKDARRSK